MHLICDSAQDARWQKNRHVLKFCILFRTILVGRSSSQSTSWRHVLCKYRYRSFIMTLRKKKKRYLSTGNYTLCRLHLCSSMFMWQTELWCLSIKKGTCFFQQCLLLLHSNTSQVHSFCISFEGLEQDLVKASDVERLRPSCVSVKLSSS